MPLIREEKVNGKTIWGIWLINESSNRLEAMLEPDKNEMQFLSAFKNETRRQHWLSYRILIRQLLKENTVEIKYHESGKPYIVNPSGHISVTHSGPYSAVIYSEDSAVGIDIERIHERIEKVTQRFLSDAELEQINDEKRIQHLVTLWAAKEAIFKLRGINDLDFRDNLYIDSFVPKESGEFTCDSLYKKIKKEYVLHYLLIKDYVLVWVKE